MHVPGDIGLVVAEPRRHHIRKAGGNVADKSADGDDLGQQVQTLLALHHVEERLLERCPLHHDAA